MTAVELLDLPQPTRRGTSNGNDRGSSYDRRKRRAFLMVCYASNIPGFARCYRCGCLLFNPDDHPDAPEGSVFHEERHPTYKAILRLEYAHPLTVDRIIPGCQGGTYRRNNIRPACGDCNSETGGALSRRGKK